jgi:hypothetical protein
MKILKGIGKLGDEGIDEKIKYKFYRKRTKICMLN